ncbi:hypothetical protein MTR67_019155, partial [Solanum verrucosum]
GNLGTQGCDLVVNEVVKKRLWEVTGISWTMPGWIFDVLHSWEEAGSHGIDRSNGELSQLVFGGQFGKKEILDALRLWATLCMRSS